MSPCMAVVCWWVAIDSMQCVSWWAVCREGWRDVLRPWGMDEVRSHSSMSRSIHVGAGKIQDILLGMLEAADDYLVLECDVFQFRFYDLKL